MLMWLCAVNGVCWAQWPHLVRTHKDEQHDDCDVCGGYRAICNLAGNADEQRAAKHACNPNEQQRPPAELVHSHYCYACMVVRAAYFSLLLAG